MRRVLSSKAISFIIVLLSMCSYGGMVLAETIVVTPVADVMVVSDDYADDNFAESDLLMVGADADGWTWHSYIRFDLSSLPKGANITNASMTLYPIEAYDGGEALMKIEVHVVSQGWTETKLSWNSQPRTDSSIIGRTTVQRDQTGPDSIDVTKAVKLWSQGQTPNHGVMLMSAESLNIRKGYHSRESTSTGTQPTLTITWQGISAPAVHCERLYKEVCDMCGESSTACRNVGRAADDDACKKELDFLHEIKEEIGKSDSQMQQLLTKEYCKTLE